ncbi:MULTISPECIES: LytR/AlgR family response regulator transcription factor [Pseudoalteromonas]|uniref:LytTR family DNA-binding domain-containing protein n=1 Tax=Pseudoalteromonas obscura TaxID=3048491 RepID=A0ABT7EKP3_9GAMM|nr:MULTISPECIES: LytTR family DNA-binding domain-containing protein [Pseudoalteromonas]MBQ4837150.1 response regulator transcription factor [Pseudoalteromonas luteoviolacea]MDK2595624.1 LytTR family DNA-binding domain-containing protein [Pseudoalteromonas sp. P94(2023)]
MRVVIVEDEPLLQQRIARFTRNILGQKLTHLGQFFTLSEAEDYLADNEVDLLLLDLNLQGQNGFSLLQNQLAKAFHTIVISAYADKAIEAFEFGVLDFIAKPLEEHRLAKALAKLTDNTLRSHYGCRYLSVKKRAAIELIEVANIAWLKADGHYSEIHLINGEEVYLHSKSIEKIQLLLPEQFERIHRSYVVNINQLARIQVESGGRYFAQLRDNTQLPIGRTKYLSIKSHIDTNKS